MRKGTINALRRGMPRSSEDAFFGFAEDDLIRPPESLGTSIESIEPLLRAGDIDFGKEVLRGMGRPPDRCIHRMGYHPAARPRIPGRPVQVLRQSR